MVWYETIVPENLNHAELDDYLSRGWYRIGQTLITTNWSILGEKFFSVFWMRYNLSLFHPVGSAKRIAKTGSSFSMEVKEVHFNAELEDLFQAYRVKIAFDTAPTLEQHLMGGSKQNIFSSKQLELRDGKKLIAVGFFDEGIKSMAGILNIYDPAYQKFSPGKLLMLHKIRQAQMIGMQFFYPGYISYCVPHFDYKFFADPAATEIFVRSTGNWTTYKGLNLSILYQEMLKNDLQLLNDTIVTVDIENQIL
jgi:arginine-tRNA-protein transferase